MALDTRTYTLATARQWVSLQVSNIVVVLTTVLAVVWSFNLWRLSSNSAVSEAEAQVLAWSYVVDEGGRVIVASYPPILMWVGLFIFLACARSLGADRRGLGVWPNAALAGPFSTEQQRIGNTPRSERPRRRKAPSLAWATRARCRCSSRCSRPRPTQAASTRRSHAA